MYTGRARCRCKGHCRVRSNEGDGSRRSNGYSLLLTTEPEEQRTTLLDAFTLRHLASRSEVRYWPTPTLSEIRRDPMLYRPIAFLLHMLVRCRALPISGTWSLPRRTVNRTIQPNSTSG